MDVSIIIVNYNTRDLLYNCLASIYRQTKGVVFEIIVSDNGSTDNSVEMIKLEFPAVIIIENKANLGFGKANNFGAAIASGQYVLFLNSDTILKNNAILFFYDYATKNNKALLGGYLYNENGDVIHSYENFTMPMRSIIRLLYYSFPFMYNVKLLFLKEGRIIEESCRSVDYICGADLFIRKSIFQKLDGFDQNFFMYFEDDDLCRRAKTLGYGSFIIAGPEIIHFEGLSLKKRSEKLKIIERSFLYYLRKHFIGLDFVIIKLMILWYVVFRFLSPFFSFKSKYELLLTVAQEFRKNESVE